MVVRNRVLELDSREKDSDGNKTGDVSSKEILFKKTQISLIQKTPYLKVNFWLMTLLHLCLVVLLAVGFNTSCSLGLPSGGSSSNDARFEESNVRAYLRKGTVGGHRFLGTNNNEEIMPKFLLNALKEHVTIDSGHLKTEIDEQLANYGGFEVKAMRTHFTITYDNIRNIVFRLRDTTIDNNRSKNSAILINCHYDTVIDSPGASDDFVSCASMLEVIRVLIVNKAHLKHDLIFLFNGAEESFLLGSHAFVTQHRWMKDIRVFINLEAAGAGGRQVVFQTGPKLPWIIEEYHAISKQPSASIIYQEIFQTGMLPSDTDFRIFRDFGNISGIDIAYSSNGYIYHTLFDREEQIPSMCIQNSGDNLLALVLRLGNSPYIDNAYTGSNKVFFDVLGLFIVNYSFVFSFCINTLCISLIGVRFVYHTYLEINHAKYVALAFLNHFVCLLCILIELLIESLMLFYLDRGMSWYSNRYNLIGLYIFPSLLVFFTYHSQMARSKWIAWPSVQTAEDAHFEAGQLWLCLPLLTLTVYGLGCSYFFMLMLIFPLFSRILIDWFNLLFPQNVGFSSFLDFCKQVFMFFVPWSICMAFVHFALDVFIPMLGRSGSLLIPDVFIALLIFMSSIFPVLYLAGKIYQTKMNSLASIRFILLHLTLSFILLILFTSIGFPYNQSNDMPRKQRLTIVHINRVFHGPSGTIQSNNSGLWVIPLDRNLVQHLGTHIPELQSTQASKCILEPYCGFPYIRPLAHSLTSFSYLPRGPHKLTPSLELTVINKVKIDRDAFNITFRLNGPSHTHILFMTEPGVNLTKWSFISERPKPALTPLKSLEKHYFVGYSYGKPPKESLKFWVVCTASASLSFDNARIGVALSGHYTDGDDYHTPELGDFIGNLPDWVVPNSWTATYERWTILLRDG